MRRIAGAMPVVAYTTAVGPGVAPAAGAEFAAEVDRRINDPRGWRKYGFTFVRPPDAASAAARPGARGPRRPGVLTIRLETGAAADALCGARGFSCYRARPGDIVIHEGNWAGGSASGLPLERYRNYVLEHELGHLLGLEHPRGQRACPTDECRRRGLGRCNASVMNQNTRGPGHVAPCVESDWPLDPEWLADDPWRAARLRAAAEARGAAAALAAAFVLVLALVLLAAAGLAAAGRKCAPPAAPRGAWPR